MSRNTFGTVTVLQTARCMGYCTVEFSSALETLNFSHIAYITALSTVTLYSPGDIRTNEFRLLTSLIFTLRPTSFTRYRSWKYRLCRHVCDPSCPRHDCLQRSENACTCRAMRNLSSGAVATIALWKSAPMATARIWWRAGSMQLSGIRLSVRLSPWSSGGATVRQCWQCQWTRLNIDLSCLDWRTSAGIAELA